MALAFQHSLGTWLVPYLVYSFRATHPQVQFELTQVRDELHSTALAGGQADLELGTRRPHDPALLTRQLALEPLRLAVPRDHRLAGRGQVWLTDVSSEPFIALRSTSALRRLTDDLCEAAGFVPDVVFEGTDLSTVRGFVAAGLGVAVVPGAAGWLGRVGPGTPGPPGDP